MAELILKILFITVCGFIGHVVVKAVTFGKVDMDCGTGAESELAAMIGLVVLGAGMSAGGWVLA